MYPFSRGYTIFLGKNKVTTGLRSRSFWKFANPSIREILHPCSISDLCKKNGFGHFDGICATLRPLIRNSIGYHHQIVAHAFRTRFFWGTQHLEAKSARFFNVCAFPQFVRQP